jgi:isopentenyldiphosphate isomerase
LWHRISRVLVRDEEGNVLLQKRGMANKILPGCWDASASGHVDPGEDFETAAAREAEEEIGLHGYELKEIDYYKSSQEVEETKLNRFNKTYEVIANKDLVLKLDPEEVSEVKWVSVAELKQLVTEHPDKVTDGLMRIAHNLIK